MLLAHKVELRPKPDQIDYLEKACGHYRHCWNHMRTLNYHCRNESLSQLLGSQIVENSVSYDEKQNSSKYF